MKKIILVMFLLCIAFYTFAQEGVLQSKTGTVEFMLAGTDVYVEAAVGDVISQDTVISTGFRSSAKIIIGHSTLSMRPLSRLTLSELQSSEEMETLNVNLQTGRVRVEVKPPAGARAGVSVQSLYAVASVRGTSFEFDTRNLYVSEGSVNIMGNRGQVITVRADEESSIGANSRAVSPIEIKTSGITPPSLPGTDSGGGTITGPVSTGVEYTLGLVFME